MPWRPAPRSRRQRALRGALSGSAQAPPLGSSGLLLHRDGRFSHEGQPIRHARLRAALEAGVRHLEEADCFVVQLGRFRARIDVEATPFFVREFEARDGSLRLSDGTCEPLRADTLLCDAEGALCCSVKGRFAARFTHAAQAELLAHADWLDAGPVLRMAGGVVALPARLFEP